MMIARIRRLLKENEILQYNIDVDESKDLVVNLILFQTSKVVFYAHSCILLASLSDRKIFIYTGLLLVYNKFYYLANYYYFIQMSLGREIVHTIYII